MDNRQMKWLVVVIAFLAVIGAVIWYFMLGGSPDLPAAIELSEPREISHSPKGEESVKVFDITAQEGLYEPARIVLKKGDKVQVDFYAADSDYDIAVAMPIGAYLKIKEGKGMAFGFEAEEAGTYEFKCQDFCPAGQEMKGEFIVIP